MLKVKRLDYLLVKRHCDFCRCRTAIILAQFEYGAHMQSDFHMHSHSADSAMKGTLDSAAFVPRDDTADYF